MLLGLTDTRRLYELCPWPLAEDTYEMNTSSTTYWATDTVLQDCIVIHHGSVIANRALCCL